MTITFDDVADGTPAEDDTLEERRMRALSMRNLGMTWQQIAERQGIDPALVKRDVMRTLRGLSAETREDMRAQQRSILMAVRRAALPTALSRDAEGRSAAARDVIACLAAEADLCGLKAPVEVMVALTNDDFAVKMSDLLNSLDSVDRKEMTRAITPDQPVIDAEVIPEPSDTGDAPPDDVAAAPGVVEPRKRPAGWSNL